MERVTQTTRVSKLFRATNSLWIFLNLLTIASFSNPTCLCVHFFSPKTIRSWIVVSIAKRNFCHPWMFHLSDFLLSLLLSLIHTLNLSHSHISSNIKSFSYFNFLYFIHCKCMNVYFRKREREMIFSSSAQGLHVYDGKRFCDISLKHQIK